LSGYVSKDPTAKPSAKISAVQSTRIGGTPTRAADAPAWEGAKVASAVAAASNDIDDSPLVVMTRASDGGTAGDSAIRPTPVASTNTEMMFG
jgi:hypothetical protein